MKRFQITTDPLSVDDVIARAAHPAAGAVSTFVGLVRGETDGREVRHLHYEAYPDMAERQMRQIGDEIRDRWPTILETAIVHRIGRLQIGQVIVVIAVSSAHRQDVFAATHYAIDRLKQTVPIWKKEVFTDGEEWRSEGVDEQGHGS
ncbi:MAG: molybdenum cofactor biosynthesis protein MoaE [Chloroflexota bacterium]|nr:molybdenum cofactor biosynthesis protein MoaE [Chloroflexota bacterium]